MEQTFEEFLDDFKGELDRISTLENTIDSLSKAVDVMRAGALSLNTVFGQNRQRITEMAQAFSDAVPGVNRLGGSVRDVSDTMQEIALASRRNVIANSEDVEKLFAASKILGSSVREISDSFIDVGVNIEQIPKALEDSIDYIQSVGGNVKQVFDKVLQNTDQLNRFQFENGVQGLTKMAAQASMLRFNMNETFQLADKVLTPEGAIETASAFQRLGVAAGNLVDPFQLMNMSINDPQGLQQSLVDVSKQFTYFDEQTKTFKINPQGVLTLKEIERQTGVSAKELSKMGLAASELDSRLTQIRPDIKFENEEDKQYLANIAKMGKGGKYEVTLEDGTKKDLESLNQEEFDRLIKTQKDADKSLEELARTQLTTSEMIMGDVRAFVNKFVYGVASNRPVSEFLETGREITNVVGGSISDPKKFSTESIRGGTENIMYSLEEFFKKMSKGGNFGEESMNLANKLGEQYKSLEKGFYENIKKITDENRDRLSKGDDSLIKELSSQAFGFISDINEKGASAKVDPYLGRSVLEGNRPQNINTTNINTQKVEFGGQSTIVIKHEFPAEFQYLSPQASKMLVYKTIEDPAFNTKVQNQVKFYATNNQYKFGSPENFQPVPLTQG